MVHITLRILQLSQSSCYPESVLRYLTNKHTKEEKSYWADIAVASYQIFFGVTVVTFFAFHLDIGSIIVIFSSLILAIITAIIGGRIRT